MGKPMPLMAHMAQMLKGIMLTYLVAANIGRLMKGRTSEQIEHEVAVASAVLLHVSGGYEWTEGHSEYWLL